MLLEGTVKVYKDGGDGKPGGFGFLKPDFGGPDVFFSIRHYSPKSEVPFVGDRVRYSEAPDTKRGGDAVMAVGVERI
jgi:cold shock CspA family protein